VKPDRKQILGALLLAAALLVYLILRYGKFLG
jgi:hypothetical protein